MMRRIIGAVLRWYQGTIPEGSWIYERHWTAEAVHSFFGWLQREWRWIIPVGATIIFGILKT